MSLRTTFYFLLIFNKIYKQICFITILTQLTNIFIDEQSIL
jgi:hypothetical protein